MPYSVESRSWIFVKGYGFLSFVENIGKNLSGKYSHKRPDTAKTSAADALKTTLKREIEKTAEATGDLISDKIADYFIPERFRN